MPDTKFKFGELKEKITRMKRELPIVLANDAQNYFTESWEKQGFDGQPWKDVKRHDTSTPEYKYPIRLRARKLSSPILVGVYRGRSGGQLRRMTSRSIRSKTFTSVRLEVDLPYAKIQNEGGTIAVASGERTVHFKAVSQNISTKKLKGVFSSKKDADYAQKVTVGAHSIVIPARPFMGQSKELTKMQREKIKTFMSGLWEK